MPIPANQITHAEFQMFGTASAAGSNNRKFEPVFHFRRTSVVNPVTKSALETLIQTNICLPICLALNNRYAQDFNTVRWINDATDPPVPTSRAVVGNRAGDSMPMQNAAYLLIRTALRGKSYRGSKHFGPLSEMDTTAGTEDIFNAGMLTLLGNIATALVTPWTDGNGNTWVLTVLSRKSSQLIANPTTVVSNDVTQILVNKRVGRMTKRQAKSVY